MRVTRSLIALSLLAGLAAGPAAGPGHSQTPAPASPPVPSQPPPHPHPHAPPAAANICTSQHGWCQLPTLSAPAGVGCVCLTAQGQQVWGVTRFFPYQGPASPYLQPHAGPPSTIP